MKKRFLWPAMILIVLSGCAPARFSEATASFSKSADDLTASLLESYRLLERDEKAARNETLLAQRVVPQFSNACLPDAVVTGSSGQWLAGCGLVRNEQETPRLAPIWQDRADAIRAARALSAYAKGLAALTSSETKEESDAAVDTIAVGAAAALSLVGSTAPAAPIVAAAIKLGGFAIVEFNEARNYRRLQNAVNEVCRESDRTDGDQCPALEAVSKVFGIRLLDIKNSRLAALYGAALATSNPSRFSSQQYSASFTRAANVADQIAALQRSDPAAAAVAMTDAHAALRAALRENKGQTAAVAKAMSEFSNRVEELKEAIEASK